MKTLNIFVAAATASMIAGAAAAQTTVFANEDAAVDAVDDLQEQIAEDAERDFNQFGNEGRIVGSYGSVALRATANSNDNDDNSNVGVGLRYGTFDGVNGIDVSAKYDYASDNGDETTNRLLAGADYRRDLSGAFFAYGKLDVLLDSAVTDADSYDTDIFAGAGVGYRILNDATSQWSIQAGPGYRYAEQVNGEDVREVAGSVSSNYYRSLSETSYLTNDTDVIFSDANAQIQNELALNVSMTNALALRTSLTTIYNDESDSSFSDANNTLGVSVVYNFN
ncbi:hypothetical protein AN189_00225 [Loktanella sp. 3ANDIMAR09]|uniref:DUF481 domain-containing protein n=1 Tax=Loktanella sp. 3ANDIMAR09 TaxID=1225657 RepID=UPI00070766C9|nr:DUF481 domain-containing protein [Loktanella sp. 3ANDIMAR09]KQI69881.1 hypothetical protein AN189_00225 [Loktanella sp. 3ANDIMAR09]